MDKDETIKNILDFHCPRYSELPAVSLYKDQVIEYVEKKLSPLNINKEDKIITPTMLNNYVKHRVISPPQDKKYDSNHVAYIITICVFKQVYSLTEIKSLIKMQQETYSVEVAYDYFCNELEREIKSVFLTRDFSKESSASKVTKESELLRSMIISFVNKIYTEKLLLDTLKQ